ncbi:transcription factor grauzone-like [Armigeres subalbatus]|uniref:transcription factor grauzone-like n=1 Tax=Armigeres subalbatus TaxID=124917 RepID=UPI002ED56670
MNNNYKCFTCAQKSEKFFQIVNDEEESKPNIRMVMCKHFWFQEDDLQSAVICEFCWEKVDQFHQFYQEVKTLHEDLLDSRPLSVYLKQEDNGCEANSLFDNCLDATLEANETSDIVECEPDIEDDSDQKPSMGDTDIDIDEKPLIVMAEDDEDVRYEIRKLRNGSKRIASEKGSKAKPSKPKKIYRKRKKLSPEQQKEEDDFIKQHRSYVCEHCYEEFDDFQAIIRHTVQVHDQPYIVCCDLKYRTRAALLLHVQHLLNPQTIKCEICNRSFKSQSSVNRHKEEVHPEEHQLIFKCERCPKSFPKQKLLQRHIDQHETLEKEKAKCPTCGKCFKTKVHLRRHILAVHEKSFEFICEVCSKGFLKHSELKAHQVYHELTAEQQKKQCPICNKWMKNLRYWRKHMGRHRGEGEYKCEHCDHVSINLLSLKLHVERKHNPKCKKYVCELCNKEYSRPVTLREHIANAHTGEPLYQCQFCEKKFFSNATMYAHRKKDHPQEWLKDHKAKFASTEQNEEGGDGSSK